MEKCFRVFILKIVISPALGRERQDKDVRKRWISLEQPAAAVRTANRAPRRLSIHGLHKNPALANSTVDGARWVFGSSVDIAPRVSVSGSCPRGHIASASKRRRRAV